MNSNFSQIQNTLGNWQDFFIDNSSLILGVLVVVVAFYFLAKLGRYTTTKATNRAGAPHSLQVLLANIIYLVIFLTGIVVVLSMLGLGKAVTTALAGAGVLGIVLGFALQDIAANFISGIVLILRKPFEENDLIEVSGHLGTVYEINLRTTKIRSLTGQMIYIPNQQVFQNDVVNYTELGERRVDISCGVSYSDDLAQARELAIQTIEDLDFVDTEDHTVELYYNEFAGSSINFTLRFWLDFSRQPDFLAGQSDAIEAIRNTYAKAGIDIPFPIRTLEFGPKGGQTLRDQLNQE